jgi:hypothetical protein
MEFKDPLNLKIELLDLEETSDTTGLIKATLVIDHPGRPGWKIRLEGTVNVTRFPE